jgi:capsular polysaccharide biosynthesis protein
VDFREFVGFLRKYSWLILAFLLIGGGGGTALALTGSKSYQAESQVLFTGSNSVAGQTEVFGVQYVLLRMPTYSELATSRAVLAPAIAELHLPTSYDALASHVSTNVATGTTLLTITVTQPTADRAQRVAQMVANSLINLIDTTELAPAASKGPAQSAVTPQVVTPSQLPAAPATPSLRLYIVGGALLGMLLGFAIGFTHWLRRSWKRETDAARATPTLKPEPDRLRVPEHVSTLEPISEATDRRPGGNGAAPAALADLEDVDQELVEMAAAESETGLFKRDKRRRA